jgi:ABC-type sugar transport system substrate-binding protein
MSTRSKVVVAFLFAFSPCWPGCGGSDSATSDAGRYDLASDQMSVNPFHPTRLPLIADELAKQFTGKAADPSTFKLGIVSMGLSAYWTALQLGASQATYKINCASSYVGASDAVEQLTATRSMIAGGYKGFAVSVAADVTKDLDGDGTPETTYRVEDALVEGVAKGMGVISYDSDSVAGSARFLYIGTDNDTAGRLAGETMANVLGPVGGKVAAFAVAYTIGGEPAANLVQRYNSALAVLTAKGIQLIRVTGPKDTFSTTAASALAQNPDLTGIMTLQATTGPIVAQALKDANMSAILKFVAFDFTPPIRSLIQEGVVHATIVQEQYWMGYLAIHILYSMSVLGNETTRTVLAPWLTGPANDILYTDLNVVTIDTFELYQQYLQALGIQG